MTNNKRVEIKLLESEYWWGGVCRHGDQMPFDSSSKYRAELGANLWGNQGAPLLVSSKGRYVWSDKPYSFEFAGGTLILQDAQGEIIQGEGYENLRGAYLDACQKFFPPSGKIPNELTFKAPLYNSWIEVLRYPTQEKLLSYAQAILDASMPPGVFIIDDWWYRSNCTWRWDLEAFPKPREMVDWLHERGFKVVVWISHFVTSDTQDFLDLMDKGWLLRTEDDQPLIRKWWNGWGGMIDLSHPEAFAWFQNQLDDLVREYGIDGFKFDGGDPWLFRGALKCHAPHTVNDFCEDFERMGLKYDLAEYRASWKFGAQHLIQRTRDKEHSWGPNGMADLLPTSLVQGLVGYPYNCPDMVGGGEDTSFTDPNFKFDQELFIRWAQLSTFFPIIQYSQLPCRVLDAEHLALCMKMLELRQSIAGEILDLARHAAKTGEPILRHMAYVFPDESMETVIDQYMLGDKYLIAPVMVQGAVSRTVKFPAGTWKGDDDSKIEGPCEIEIQAPLSRLPRYTHIG